MARQKCQTTSLLNSATEIEGSVWDTAMIWGSFFPHGRNILGAKPVMIPCLAWREELAGQTILPPVQCWLLIL